jgi:hypothetical protein
MFFHSIHPRYRFSVGRAAGFSGGAEMPNAISKYRNALRSRSSMRVALQR